MKKVNVLVNGKIVKQRPSEVVDWANVVQPKCPAWLKALGVKSLKEFLQFAAFCALFAATLFTGIATSFNDEMKERMKDDSYVSSIILADD